MNNTTKWYLATGLLLVGGGLIAWNVKPADGPRRSNEVKKEDPTVDSLPAAVQAVVRRESAGGEVTDIDQEKHGQRTDYDIEIRKGANDIELTIADNGTVRKRKVTPSTAAAP